MLLAGGAGVAAGAVCLVLAAPASAVTTLSGPLDLGAATPYGVLAADAVSSTGATLITGDLGLSPSTATSITGFPPGIVTGAVTAGDATAILARDDLTAAYGVAASLTPSSPTTVGDLAGLTLVPGVYAGGELTLSGVVTLDGGGDADAVWVFQAASTLVTAAASEVRLVDGASSCNVFWKVGSSATLGGGSDFVGTILADVSITAITATTVEGRLLARTGAVELDATVVTVPTGCADTSSSHVGVSPAFTSPSPDDGVVGSDYLHSLAASGTGTISYAILSGALPPGLTLDSASGAISGTPESAGAFEVRVAARGDTGPDAELVVRITVTLAELAASGTAPPGLLAAAGGAVLLGGLLVVFAARGRPRGELARAVRRNRR